MTILKAGQLILRPPRAGDEEDIIRGLNNFNVSQWTARIPYPYTLADAGEYLARCAQPQEGTSRLAIVLEDEVIGCIGCEADEEKGDAEIGYWLAEPHWGRGYVKAAARAVTGHAFASLKHQRLVAGYRHGNEASRRILEGLGFVKTGDAMQFSKAVGAETPTTRLELTRENWLKLRDRLR